MDEDTGVVSRILGRLRPPEDVELRIDDDGVTFCIYRRNRRAERTETPVEFYVAFGLLRTEHAIIAMTMHLTQKAWMTPYAIHMFLDAAFRKIGHNPWNQGE